MAISSPTLDTCWATGIACDPEKVFTETDPVCAQYGLIQGQKRLVEACFRLVSFCLSDAGSTLMVRLNIR
jgi:hypothetical protein